jgi:leucyl aminopeptidase
MRRFCGTASRALLRIGVKTVGVIVPAAHASAGGVEAGVEGFLAGPGGIDAHRTGEKRRPDPYRGEYSSLTLFLPDRITSGLRSAVRRGEIVAEAMILTRRLTNEPGNLMTPARLATEARRAGRAAGVSVTVWERRQIEEHGLGGLLAVTAGSALPPRFIIMRYTPEGGRGKNAPLVLVGKGITFDSGGISIKPGKGMEEMKADMAGAAAVIGALSAIGRLQPRGAVIGVIPACENMPSGSATRPGDVITAYGGTTIEVVNTDAEGRLILADALAWAREQEPSAIVDIATLTGSCVVSLGHIYAGLMANDEAWARVVRETALAQGEKVWQLPMDPEYDELVKSDIADIRNTGTDHPGTITAAKLLERFTGEVPWVHLDIAGMEWRKDARPWVGAGPTAFGVRTFVALALR